MLITFIGVLFNKCPLSPILSSSGRKYSFAFWNDLLSTTMIMLLTVIKSPPIMSTLAQKGKTPSSKCCQMSLITLSKSYFISSSTAINSILSLFTINLRPSLKLISWSISWRNGQARRTFRFSNC